VPASENLRKTGHYPPLSGEREIGVTFNHELPTGRAEVLSVNGSASARGGPLIAIRELFHGRTRTRNRVSNGRFTMKSTALMLTGMVLIGLATVTSPQLGFAQSSPQIGTWKLNLQKSEFIPGPAPRSRSLNITQDGQNIRDTVLEIDAQGNVRTSEVMHVYDGQPHPATGFPDFDATVITKVDANPFSLIAIRLKAGKLIQVATFVISHDGKTLTITVTGINVNGQPVRSVALYDKQ
jgi:hypothetical protein